MREPGCKKDEEEIGRELTGTWWEEHLFILKQSMALFDFYTGQIQACGAEIERVYGMMRPDWNTEGFKPLGRRKRNSHSKKAPQHPEEIRNHLKRISGVD